MSKDKFAELFQPEPPIGVMEAVKEGIQAVAPGLSLSKILGDIGKELSHLGSQGSHEMAAALFNGSAFVMYPRTGQEDQYQGQEDPQPGLPIEAMKQPDIDTGREM